MVDQIDVVVDFCTNIMTMIKKLADGEQDMGKIDVDPDSDEDYDYWMTLVG